MRRVHKYTLAVSDQSWHGVRRVVTGTQSGEEMILAAGGAMELAAGGAVEIAAGGAVEIAAGGAVELQTSGAVDLTVLCTSQTRHC
jgi:hypothetical protein